MTDTRREELIRALKLTIEGTLSVDFDDKKGKFFGTKALHEILETIDAYVQPQLLAARIDELERVKSVTLDWDVDVWSTTDDGQLIPLTARLDELSKEEV